MSVVLEDDRLVVEAIKTNDRSAVEQVVAVRPGAAKAVDERGVSVLMLARYYGRDEIAETLMKALPEIDVFEAAAYDNLDHARELVSTDPSIVDRFSPDGFTPLQLASYFRSYRVASYLLEHGADVNAVAQNGSRVQALHSAVSNRHVDIVRLLLDSGANVNGRQESGYTPLHAAAANGDSEIVSLLLQFGADVNQVKSDGKAAADLAVESGHAELARRLRTSS